jgi:addiction module RelE/StbE family toxin
MRIYYSRRFAKKYKRLPNKIKLLAEIKENLFRKNPFDPRLKTHRLTGNLQDYWSFSIDHHYRIIFEFAKEDIIWFHSVGTHTIYEN